MNSEIVFNERGTREKRRNTEPYVKGNVLFYASSIFFLNKWIRFPCSIMFKINIKDTGTTAINELRTSSTVFTINFEHKITCGITLSNVLNGFD